MPSLLPWRMPAWLADVIDGRIASQRDSLWVPSRTQLAIVFTEPARIRPARIGWASPSIWMITRPGLSVWPVERGDQESLDEQPVVRAAAVDAQDRRQDRVDDRVDERRDEGRAEAVDVDARGPLRNDEERHDLEHEDEDGDEDQRDGRRESQGDGPDRRR